MIQLTTAQAAEQLRLTVSMVRRYCRDGRLPAQKVGRDWLIRNEDLEQFKAIPRKVGRPKLVDCQLDNKLP